MQNNMFDLFGIMNLLDPNEWGDEDEFLERYGGCRNNDETQISTADQIQALKVETSER